jgi:riboflavin kinase/FMN adenylyltransferase
METIKSINKIRVIKKSVITIGNFDGLHIGHKILINKTVKDAKKYGAKSVVFTFENHPVNFFRSNFIKKLNTNKDKENGIKNLNVDIMINIPFDNYMTQVSARDFVKDILIDKLNVKKIIVGYDFTFAKNKEGNCETLKKLALEFGFDVEIVEPIKIKNIRVSSTYIRDLIESGNLKEVYDYLGYNYSLEGEVIHSKKLGRTIGFPTANININEDVLIPKTGIYATKVHIEGKIYFGATNIGFNPTVSGNDLSIETHILNFDKDIYSKVVRIEFLERIRDEKKFNSLDDLKQQLAKDTKFVYENYVCKKS